MRCLRCCLAALLGGLVLSFTASAANVDPGSYGYPISNPFEATITSSPASLQPEVPISDDIRQDDYELELLPKRIGQVPETFWAVEKLHYRLARQDGPAPLIFIIAGTGARYDDKKPEFLKKLFYGAGYHVVQISSPTNFDFIVSPRPVPRLGFPPRMPKTFTGSWRPSVTSKRICRLPAMT